MLSRFGIASCFLALCLLVAAGCSKGRPDPCGLLRVSEAQLFDDTISTSRSLPAKGVDKNDLCLFYNSKGEPRLMLFVWIDDKIDPIETARSGMSGDDSEVIEIAGVGEKAAAGFRSGVLKLFAARNERGMIGVRVRDTIGQDGERFEDVKALVAKLLGRLK